MLLYGTSIYSSIFGANSSIAKGNKKTIKKTKVDPPKLDPLKTHQLPMVPVIGLVEQPSQHILYLCNENLRRLVK
jgi:hypothetical protein